MTRPLSTMVDNLLDSDSQEPPAKEIRLEEFSQAGPSAVPTVNETISEEAVRRYLETRPMPTTDLVRKFMFRKTGIQNGQLLRLLAGRSTHTGTRWLVQPTSA